MATSDKPSPADRLLDAVGGAQSLALSMTRQATSYAAERIPPVPGFPADVLDGPAEVVDNVFEQIEEALAERSPRIRDVVHQQGTFVRGVFDSITPIVDALAGGEAGEEATTSSADTGGSSTDTGGSGAGTGSQT